jgi:xanthine dehydrogenase molybdenum-binding subunit
MSDLAVVGKSVVRTDAVDKVTGRAQYTSDLKLPGMLFGAFLRSPHAHARIKRIDLTKAEKLPGVKAVLTQATVAGRLARIVDEAHGTSSQAKLFADDRVTYQGEKIAAVAATTRDIAEEAVSLIDVEYEVLPALIDPRDAIKPDAPLIFAETAPQPAPDFLPLSLRAGQPEFGAIFQNVLQSTEQIEGNVDEGFAQSDRIFEDNYVVPRAHQSYIEPQVAIADRSADGRITCWTSTQGIFATRANLAQSLNIPPRKINVVGMTIGGGFGAKGGGVVDTYAVLLAEATGRPVKIVYSREEEFLDGRPAPGLRIWLKTGVRDDGKILARQALALWDIGVGGRAAWVVVRFKGLYDTPNVKVQAYDVATNKPPTGAYRAPGGPQMFFAVEAQMNRIAADLGIDPIDFRLLNLREGREIGFKQVLRKAGEAAGWWTRTKRPNEGWGVAVGGWGGFNIINAPTSASCILQDDGSLHVFSGMVDLSGTATTMAQIAAQVVGLAIEDVTVTAGDTDSSPIAPISAASQITFAMGNAVKRAAEVIRLRVLETAAEMLEARPTDLEVREGKVSVRGVGGRFVSLAEVSQKATASEAGPIGGRGSFAQEWSATGGAAQIVRVEVDPSTGKVWLRQFVGAQDCGKAINPMAVEGQMEGGAAQGLGWGLWEQMVYAPDGQNLNPGFLDYHLPTALDLPDLSSILVEVPTDNGPFGAKGVGEPPITPGIAAVQDAIADAIGVRLTEVPFTPERVRAAVRATGGA